MKTSRIMWGFVLTVGIGVVCLLWTPAKAAEADLPVPRIIQNGFNVWAKKETPSYAFDVWKKDGLLEQDRKPDMLAGFFRNVDRNLGTYRSYEVVQTKRIGDSSAIFYVAIKFEKAGAYARFLVYHGDKDWVVQNMDFSLKPEAIMPWLAFTGDMDVAQTSN